MYVFILVAIVSAITGIFLAKQVSAPVEVPPKGDKDNQVMCTADAMQCKDGSYVGRTGPKCEFVCPTAPTSTAGDKSDLIKVETPATLALVTSPLQITGLARGSWFFEASFPIRLEDDKGNLIASGIATALGEWMTSEFVPFSATLNFTISSSTSKNGKLILKKDNPSGLPEHDDALEIAVRFAP